METPVTFGRIPHDEQHRFLKWQSCQADCWLWSRYLQRKGIPHEIAKATWKQDRWTIYKHMWTPTPQTTLPRYDGYEGAYCCGAEG